MSQIAVDPRAEWLREHRHLQYLRAEAFASKGRTKAQRRSRGKYAALRLAKFNRVKGV